MHLPIPVEYTPIYYLFKWVYLCIYICISSARVSVTELLLNGSTDFYETSCVFLSESLNSLYYYLQLNLVSKIHRGAHTMILRFTMEIENFVCV